MDTNKIQISESRLNQIIIEGVMEAMNEGIFSRSDKPRWHGSAIDSLVNREVLDGQPQTIEDVMKGDHVKLVARKPIPGGGERLYVTPESHEFGAIDDFQKEKGFEEELNIVLQPKGQRAIFKGRLQSKPHIQVFDIVRSLKEGYINGSSYDAWRTATPCDDYDEQEFAEGYDEAMDELYARAEEAGVSTNSARFRDAVRKLQKKYAI